MTPLGIGICAVFVVQWLAFVPSYLARTERFFDLTGAITYVAVTVGLAVASAPLDLRSWVLAAVVIVWALRLGTFLFARVMRADGDSRFDERKNSPVKFFAVWTLQGVWITLTAAAAWVAITVGERVEWDGWATAGLAVWAVGMTLEVVADAQKSRFKASPENKGRFISTGLWAVSRHPNYLGEILLWTGVALIAVPTLSGWQWAAMVSPLFVALLLTRVSGVPLLEAKARASWGGVPDYESYVARTPMLVPSPASIARAMRREA